MIILADKQPRCTRLRPEAAMLFKKRNSRPTAEEAARRLLALKCVTVDAHAAPPAEMLERFEPDWTEIQRCEFAQEEHTIATTIGTRSERVAFGGNCRRRNADTQVCLRPR